MVISVTPLIFPLSRVGFAQPKQKPDNIITSSVDDLLDRFHVLENPAATPAWDFVWNAVVEEGREKRMLRQPFLNMIDDLPFGSTPLEPISLAESAVKVRSTVDISLQDQTTFIIDDLGDPP
jgi:hypothetical protein